MIKYNQRVKVKAGFYESCWGYVQAEYDFSHRPGCSGIEYHVFFETGGGHAWFLEDELEVEPEIDLSKYTSL